MLHPTYQCHQIPRDLELTGRLTDPLWQDAEVVELTHPLTGEPQAFSTYVRLLYNERYLYIAFQCEDEYINASHTAHDSPVWEEGCCEVFLAPSGKMRQYFEINVSPLNTVFDAFILNGGSPEREERHLMSFVDHTCEGLVTKVHVDGTMGIVGGVKGWTVEYALPFRSLIGADHLVPEPGDSWLMNLCRISSPRDGNDSRFYSWATLDRLDFHRPWCWGTLRFN